MLTYLVSKLHIEIQLKVADPKPTNYFSQNFNAGQCEEMLSKLASCSGKLFPSLLKGQITMSSTI